MKVSFEGIGEMVATFPVKGAVVKGQMVKLTQAGQVSPCQAGDSFCGLAVNVREGFAGVQFAGLAQVSYSGDSAPVCGWNALVADGTGGVSVAEESDESGAGTDTQSNAGTAAQSGGSAREFLIVAVDTAGKTAVVRL